MTNRTAMGIVLLVLVQGLAGCGGSGSSPSAPSPVPPPAAQPAPSPTSINGLMLFTDQSSGFSTSDVRDAQEQIVQFNTAGELIWTADGTRFPGFGRGFLNNYISNLTSCQCDFVVHFGTRDGERRAYLTADYGHDNPDTVLDLEVAGGVLTVGRTDVYPPGTYILSGVVTEVTATGQAPIEGAGVWRLNEDKTGWRVGTTDKNGFYEIRGLSNGTRDLAVIKEGYETAKGIVSIDGHTRFDAQLVRR